MTNWDDYTKDNPLSDSLDEQDVRDMTEGGEPPRQLKRELPEPTPFPCEALGEIIGSAAKGLCDIVQAPVAICGQSLLSVANLVTQAHADVIIFNNQRRPISLYLVTIAASGDRKTTADEKALTEIRKHEASLRIDYEQARSKYRLETEVYEKERQAILKKAKTCREAKIQALQDLGEEPQRPLEPLIIVSEPTYEGLVQNLQLGQPSQGIFSSEAGRFVSGHAMSEENKIKTSAALSEMWDGVAVNRCRKGDGSYSLPGRRLCMHLMIQPGVSATLLGDKSLGDQGLLSRLLVAFPNSLAGTRFHREPQQTSLLALHKFDAYVETALALALPLVSGKCNELQPRDLCLSENARRLLITFANEVEKELVPGGDLEEVRGLASKLPEHAARIAGTIVLFENPLCTSIEVEEMERGIGLASFYLEEARRIFFASAVEPDIACAEQLLQWLLLSWPGKLISLPDIYQRGPNSIRDKRKASKMTNILEEHGWLLPFKDGAIINNVFRKKVWMIIRG